MKNFLQREWTGSTIFSIKNTKRNMKDFFSDYCKYWQVLLERFDMAGDGTCIWSFKLLSSVMMFLWFLLKNFQRNCRTVEFKGHKKGSLIVSGYCWFCWEILRFTPDSFFLFLPHSLVFFLSVEAVRELKKKERDKDTFRLKLYFRIYDYSEVGIFSWTSRNSHISQTRYWSILLNPFQQLQDWGSVMCSAGMFSSGCY